MKLLCLPRTVAGVPRKPFFELLGVPVGDVGPYKKTYISPAKSRYSKSFAIVLNCGSGKRLPYNNVTAISPSNQNFKKQHNKKKPAFAGFKVFSLSDAETVCASANDLYCALDTN